MKPKSTDAQRERKREAFWSAVSSTLIRLAAAALLLWLRMGRPPDSLPSKLLLVILVLELGSILPIWINLKARLKEIDGGEEDEARKY